MCINSRLTIACTRTAKSAARTSLCFLLPVMRGVRQSKVEKGIMMNGELPNLKVHATGTVTDPEDFTRDSQVYRRNVLTSSSLSFLLIMSASMEPEVLGIKISQSLMWGCLAIIHLYQFVMWRLTSPIEMDTEKSFFNFKGLWKQAVSGGTKEFPGKTKAQVIMLRALPIWAFLFGSICIIIGVKNA